MKKRVIVGLSHYNQPCAIAPQLASIRSDKYDIRVEIHQNAGFLPVTEAIDKAIEANKDRGLVIVHHVHSKNDPLSSLWNEMMIAAYGDPRDLYDALLILNDDVVLAPGDVDLFADACVQHAEDNTSIVACRANHTLHGPGHAIGFSAFGLVKGCFDKVGCFDENFLPCFHEDQDYAYRCRLAGLHEVGIEAGLTHGGSKHLLDDSALYVEAIRARNGVTQPLNGEYYRSKWFGDAGEEGTINPFDKRKFGVYISPENRHCPYPGYNRTDHHIVTV